MLDFVNVWYPIQIKQHTKTGLPDIDSFEAVMTCNDCTKGFFISLDFSTEALAEIQAYFNQSAKIIIPLTVREILDKQIAMKLA